MSFARITDQTSRRTIGKFDPTKAETFVAENTTLFRTANGRWILSNETDVYLATSPHNAARWLIKHGFDAVYDHHFGTNEHHPTEPPNLGGRPIVGKRIDVRLPETVLETLDSYADAQGVNRSEAIRQLLVTGLDTAGWRPPHDS